MMNFEAIKNIFYPVGCKYESATDNRNPSQILGFGTWEPVVGLIAGVGTATDTHGMAYAFTKGAQKGYLRVGEEHFVATTKTPTLTMDPVEPHAHEVDQGTEGGGSGVQNGPTTGGTITTEGAGGHTPTGKVSDVTIGTGTTTSGTAFVNPYYGMYIWVRTA
ncbi:phage baseplate protein [Citrobacter portucalensis]|uniref:phage baseplate protein n=1 Tax=Citrobacter portucalensis TaxID=1639133 RepID=UPI0039FC3D3A